MRMKWLAAGTVVGAMVVLGAMMIAAPLARAAPTTIKVATVMPRGMPWTRALARFAADVKRLTKGQVIIKMYFGGVAGTEVRSIRRLQANQIQAVAVGSVGLSRIDKSIRVLELPLLFRTTKEFRFVAESMHADFGRRYVKRGYRLLSLVSLGWVYFFSKTELSDVTKLGGRAMWAWKLDPAAAAMARVVSKTTLRLPLSGVLWALQSKSLDTIYGVPQAVLALQWNTSVRYMLNLRINQSIAGLVVREDVFKRLAPAHQKILLWRGRVLQRRITSASRRLNLRAQKTMLASGISQTQPSVGFKRRRSAFRKRLWKGLTNVMYKPADLKKVRALLTLCRSTSCRIATSGRLPMHREQPPRPICYRK
jgi:TRAP-type transport system periplasmic protein